MKHPSNWLLLINIYLNPKIVLGSQLKIFMEVVYMWENLGNMMEMVKKVQQNVDNVQEHLKSQHIEVSSGDVIKLTLNGQQELLAIEINSKYLSVENGVLLQDLLVATINNGLTKSRELQQAAMSKLTGDLNLPKIPGLF